MTSATARANQRRRLIARTLPHDIKSDIAAATHHPASRRISAQLNSTQRFTKFSTHRPPRSTLHRNASQLNATNFIFRGSSAGRRGFS